MNTERLFNLIITDLTADRLKVEQELERVINSDMEIEPKITKIKNLLSSLALKELSINKFVSMVGDNTNKKEEQNGKV